MHFDENQFENNRADERKLLRPYGKPNLLHLENNSNEVINNMSTNNDYKYEDNANNLNENSYSNINNGDDTITELEIISADCGANKSKHFEATDVIMSDTASNKNLDEIIKSFKEQIKKLKKSVNIRLWWNVIS